MKKILFIFSMLTITAIFSQSCTPTNKVVINREVDTTDGSKMLLGTQSRSQFEKEPYSTWYNSQYQQYQMDAATVEELKKEKLKSYQIVAFLGTWCGDSHRNFPRFMKILDEVGYSDKKLTIIAVNRKKEAPNGEEGLYNVKFVPTFIVKKYGKEIGRIVENPKSGWLEKDLLEIIKKDNTSLKDLIK